MARYLGETRISVKLSNETDEEAVRSPAEVVLREHGEEERGEDTGVDADAQEAEFG